jgi:hypothetical protein
VATAIRRSSITTADRVHGSANNKKKDEKKKEKE